jgi:hypothetical protein
MPDLPNKSKLGVVNQASIATLRPVEYELTGMCHDVCRWSLQAQVADWNAKLWRSRASRRSDGRRNELRKPVSP